jgi:CDP-diacylglycerol--serine O-phosphatidyltransferase
MKIKLFTIPNLITCLNLLMGCAALLSAFRGDLKCAFWFVVAAAGFDFLDGFFARLLKQYSEVGKQLDSLADMVSFGTVPAIVMWRMLGVSQQLPFEELALLGFVIAPMSALRLAKFNIDERQTTEFIGLPTPANALLVTSLSWFEMSWWGLCILTLVVSWLLVSEIPMFSLKFKGFSFGNNKLKYLFLSFVVIVVAFFGIRSVALVLVVYILISVFRNFVIRLHSVKK